MYMWGKRTLLPLNYKKVLGTIFFLKNVVPKESFFFVASDVVPILYNKPCILEINIFGKDGIIQIWIISSKDINTQCLCKIYCRELGQYLMQLKKSLMRLQITAFKNCNKWTPVYKHYWRLKVYILNKCSHSTWKTI